MRLYPIKNLYIRIIKEWQLKGLFTKLHAKLRVSHT
jgi:hypothetical protein